MRYALAFGIALLSTIFSLLEAKAQTTQNMPILPGPLSETVCPLGGKAPSMKSYYHHNSLSPTPIMKPIFKMKRKAKDHNPSSIVLILIIAISTLAAN